MSNRYILSTLVLSLFLVNLNAQSFFKSKTDLKVDAAALFSVDSDKSATFELNEVAFKDYLSQAPLLGERTSDINITIPALEGDIDFAIYESPVMMDEISDRYPFIKSYKIYATDGTPYNGRIAVGKSGISGVFQTPNGTVFFDPIDRQQLDLGYIFYYASNQIHNIVSEDPSAIACGHHDSHAHASQIFEQSVKEKGDFNHSLKKTTLVEFQTYRTAIGVTGEFTQNRAGGSTTMALELVNVAVNRLNQIFENEISVRLMLIDRQDEIIFEDPSNDPYGNGELGGQLVGTNTNILNQRLGPSTYDWGHVFTGRCTDGVAGIASLGSICNDFSKGNGVTCFANGNIEGAASFVMAHELGHQMSAPHSWNGCEAAADQYAPGADFEPGSGTTIMSYAGICGQNNIQNFADDYYHSGSTRFIHQFMRFGNGATCATLEDFGNHSPTVSLPYESGFYIPISTPFELEGTATDVDNDALTYSWEQRDSALSVQPLGQPFGRSPLFRAFPPSPDGNTRVFPRLNRILNNQNIDPQNHELLPDYERLLSFALVARDNSELGGTISEAHVRFFSTESAGPFRVTTQNDFESYEAGDKVILAWDVANTDQAPINTTAVSIMLSTDGGLNFDHVLASSTLNDGIEEVFLPQIPTNQARIKIKAIDNIYFDINDRNFMIGEATNPGFILDVPSSYFDHCGPEQLDIAVGASSFLGFDEELNLSLENTPDNLAFSFENDVINSNGNTTLSLDFSNINSATSLIFDLVAISETADTITKSIQVDFTSNDFSDLVGEIPADGATSIGETPFFQWTSAANADEYVFQLSTNPSFDPSNTTEVTGITDVSINLGDLLEKGTIYYWRAIPVNSCGLGQPMQTNAFSTLTLGCFTAEATDLPKNISQSGVPTIESNIFITQQGTVADVNVDNVFGIHDDVADLQMTLTSPQGTEIRLVTNRCFGANFLCGFDDQAGGNVSCPLSANNTYRPEDALSAFEGQQYEGEWTLTIRDTAPGAGGQFNEFELTICGSVELQAPFIINNEVLEVRTGEGRDIFSSQLKAGDGNNPDDELIFTVVRIPEHGLLTLDGSTLEIGDQFSQTDINNDEIRYEHNGNEAEEDGFDFTVVDGEGGWVEITRFIILIDPDFTSSANDFTAEDNRFEVFPVPANNLLFLKQESQEAFSAELFDHTGRMVYSQIMRGATEQIDLSNLVDGHYILKLRFENQIQIEKVVKL